MYKISDLTVADYLAKMAVCDFPGPAAGSAAGIHQRALPLFEALGDPATLEYEIRHQQIIAQFGRYPHRNEALKRVSSPAEIEFLKQPGSSF